MNPIYSVLESPHRWLILAGISFGAGFVGSMMMIAYNWPHIVPQVWFYAGALLTLVFLGRAFWDWKQRMEAVIAESDEERESLPRTQSVASERASAPEP